VVLYHYEKYWSAESAPERMLRLGNNTECESKELPANPGLLGKSIWKMLFVCVC